MDFDLRHRRLDCGRDLLRQLVMNGSEVGTVELEKLSPDLMGG
jgi:hypothetical protein